MTYEIVLTALDGSQKTYKIENLNGMWHVDGRQVTIDASSPDPGALSLLIGGRSFEARKTTISGENVIDVNGQRYAFEVRDPKSLKSRRRAAAGHEGPKKVTAPMPGKVIRIIAPTGTEVEAGAGVVVIEAMKMQNELKSPKAGRVAKISVKEGDTVNPGDTLAIIE
jgi:biotin carboxyl carrier protein